MRPDPGAARSDPRRRGTAVGSPGERDAAPRAVGGHSSCVGWAGHQAPALVRLADLVAGGPQQDRPLVGQQSAYAAHMFKTAFHGAHGRGAAPHARCRMWQGPPEGGWRAGPLRDGAGCSASSHRQSSVSGARSREGFRRPRPGPIACGGGVAAPRGPCPTATSPRPPLIVVSAIGGALGCTTSPSSCPPGPVSA